MRWHTTRTSLAGEQVFVGWQLGVQRQNTGTQGLTKEFALLSIQTPRSGMRAEHPISGPLYVR